MNRLPLFVLFISLPFLSFISPMQGQVSFFQPPAYVGSGTVFVADFNNDGKLDLLTADGTMNLGNGDGTFTPGTNLSVPSGQSVLAVADFNGDGKPDVLEQNTSTSTLQVLLGNGDGTFQAPISTPSAANLAVVAAADLNGDGKVDVIGIFNTSLLVYISKGDGTFSGPAAYPMATTGVVLTPGDYNNDGKMDIAVGSPPDEIVFLGNGDGTLQTPAKNTSGVTDQGFTIAADFNGDKNLDLVIGGSSHVYLLKGNGDGSFQAPIILFPFSGVLFGEILDGIAAADLNGDGRLDLIVQQDPTVAQIYLQNPDGTFTNDYNYILNLPPIYHGYASWTGFAVADFDSDGKLDIAGGNAVLPGNGDGSFQGIQFSIVPVNNAQSSVGAVVGDFERNGKNDVASVSGSNVYILHNNGQGLLSVLHTYAVQVAPYEIGTADFNGDGKLDLVVFGIDSGQNWSYSILLGNGDGSFQSPKYYPQGIPGSPYASFVIADFNNDHKLDLAIQAGNQTFAVILGNGDGTFGAPAYYYDGANPKGPLLAGDFNRDGSLDIAVLPSSNTNPVGTGILYGKGDGTFQPIIFPASLNGFSPEFIADVNNDGKPDLIGIQVALGNGDGTFTVLPARNFANGIADFNGDGKLDFFIDTGTGVTSVSGLQLGNGDGTFEPLIQAPATGTIQPYLFADMNGDGRTDVIFLWDAASDVLFHLNGIGVLLNTTPPSFGVYGGDFSPSPVPAGNSATTTINVVPNFGFSSTVTLSCSGLPTGATCTFNPPTIANALGSSTLTIVTSTSTPVGNDSAQVIATSGALTTSTTLPLLVTFAAPDFSVGPASGSPKSQTIAAGQTASFSLDLAPVGGFTGTVNFSCAITPAVTPAPTCTVPISMQIGGSGTQSVSVSVATTASVTSSVSPLTGFPPAAMPLAWTLTLLGSGWIWWRNRRRAPILALPLVLLAALSVVACGGGVSSSHHTTPGTPAGTYNVTVTATSGGLSHNTPLQVIVQ